MSEPDFLPLDLKEEYEYLLHYGVAPKGPAEIQRLIGRFQQCLLGLHGFVEKQSQKATEVELQRQLQGFHDPFAQKRDAMTLKEVELVAKEERLKSWEHDLEEGKRRIASQEHGQRSENMLFEETSRLKRERLAQVEQELITRERRLEGDREEMRFREMDLKRVSLTSHTEYSQ